MRSKAIINLDNLKYNLDLITEKIDKEKTSFRMKSRQS